MNPDNKDNKSGIDMTSPKSAGKGGSPSKKREDGDIIDQSEATNKTRATTKSKVSNKSGGKSEKSDKRQRGRERFEVEKSVNQYKHDKDIEVLEEDFEYKSDEQSIYRSFRDFDAKVIPIPVTKKFSINKESSENKKQVADMIKRFNEKTLTYELMIKFNMTVEKTDESTISMAGNTPGEIVD